MSHWPKLESCLLERFYETAVAIGYTACFFALSEKKIQEQKAYDNPCPATPPT